LPVQIAIANQKGGAGKTTTAINLATCLAVADKRALLIDMDPQANATSGLGIDSREIKKTVYNALIQETDSKDLIIETQVSGMHIVPSHIDLIGAELELVSVIGREFRLRTWLDHVNSDYDFVIIDCPPSLGILTVNALTASNSILIPLQTEYFALEGLSALINTVKLIQTRINPGLRIEGIVLTMYDVRNNLSRQVEEEVRSHFKKEVFDTVVVRNVRLSEAPSFGKPILSYDIKSKGAQCYLSLTREILRRYSQDSQDSQDLDQDGQLLDLKDIINYF